MNVIAVILASMAIVALESYIRAYLRARREAEDPTGFQEALRNPGVLRRVSAQFKLAATALSGARDWSDGQLESAVRWRVFEMRGEGDKDEYANRVTLLGLRARIEPILVGILEDVSLSDALLAPVPDARASFNAPPIPILRICHAFPNKPSGAVVDALLPFLTAESPEVKDAVMRLIGATGSMRALAPLRQAFLGGDAVLRNGAIAGLAWADYHDNFDPALPLALFDDLVEMIRAGDMPYDGTLTCCTVLIRFAPEGASKLFLSSEFLNAESSQASDVLRSFERAGVKVPRELLLSILRSFGSTDDWIKQADIAKAAVRLLGRHQDPGDRPLLESLMTFTAAIPEAYGDRIVYCERQIVSMWESAAEGLLASFGLEDVRNKIWDLEKRGLQDRLSLPQRYLNAVYGLDAEVCNGGFAQYFFNSGGASWKDALDGFEAMGMSERGELLRTACAALGKQGPATNREKRGQQLAKLAEAEEYLFDDLDKKYYACKENRKVHQARYVIANADAFR